MRTISAANVNTDELTQLESVVTEFPTDSVLRDAVDRVSESVRAGRDLIMASESEFVTPAVAARIIGVSRAHLYKLMDNDTIGWVSVGRDRRIACSEIRSYLSQQSSVRKDAAERFAHSGDVRKAALDRYKARNSKP